MNMFREFKNPSNKYRPIPFWSWNDKLDTEELKWQIEEMKKARVGGYFMHARSGLKTEYLSEEWFDCIKAGIDKAKETGLDAWAYDEEGWPSGFAGGIVPAMDPDYHAKFISLQVCQDKEQISEEGLLGLYAYREDTKEYRLLAKAAVAPGAGVTRKAQLEGVSREGGEVFLVVKRNTNQFYIDTMNKRAVEAFLQVTHQEYFNRFGEDFGKYMKGFFTDEPRLTCNNFLDLAWSDDLPQEFTKTYGYDILDVIPALYYETDQYEKVRYDFWTLVNHMFVHHYMKTIYDWCEAHNCKSTGHIMMEESIFSQMTSTAGVMPFYEFLHIPGIDWLRRPISSPVIAKQVGSAACQLGKKQVLTESFALCGWDVTFEELKWIAEWQFVNGVNQICQHLQGYTIKGVRKRDYPPSLFIQQTWWEEYGRFNDYLGRLCAALSEGNQTADVLLLHPMRSGYVLYDGTRTDAIRALDDAFTAVSETLSGQHISYHFGDETLIGRHGDVEGNRFIVGEIGYETVILPQMYAIDGRTVELLLQFVANGGTVLSMGRLPSYTNGSKENLEKLLQAVETVTHENVRSKMAEKKLLALGIAAKNPAGALEEVQSISYQQRDCQEGTLLFLVNHNQLETYETTVTVLGRKCKVQRLVPETGEVETLSYDAKGTDTLIRLTFEPMQSYMILVSDLEAGDVECLELPKLPVQEVALTPAWKIDFMDLNSMTLDMCMYSIDGGDWQGPVAVIQLQNRLLDLQRPCDVKLKFAFDVEADLQKNKEFYVVVEDAPLYKIFVNGTQVSTQEQGYWKDKSFKKVDIRAAVHQGSNEILLETRFTQPQKVYDVLYGENVYETEINKITYDMEIENIYLLGDFGVVSRTPYVRRERRAMVTEGPFVIVDAPTSFANGDFTTNGLLFFAGALQVSQSLQISKEEGKQVLLRLGDHNSPLVQVYVNGQKVKDSLWAPYMADITDACVDGENEIVLKIYASNRNLFGPHHHINGECYNVGPESFTGKWSWVERTSEADATEIFDKDKDYWTDTYCFVEFGLEK